MLFDLSGRVALVNNAGNGGRAGMTPQPFREMDPTAWEGPIRVNLYGVLHCCRAVINGMCGRGWGRIITIASGAGTAGVGIGVSPYAAGKGAGIASPARSPSKWPATASPPTRSRSG